MNAQDEYLLRIVIRWMKSSRREAYVQKELRFASELDALACRDAILKATTVPRGLELRVLRAEKPL